MNLKNFFAVALFLLFCHFINAQCTADCCKKEKSTKDAGIIKSSLKVDSKKKEVVCKLSDPELQKRKETVIASLKAKVLEKMELENGYKYKFAGTDDLLDEITAFIKSERSCCDFFDFSYTVSEKNLWLTITGPKGTKEFIKDDMGL